MTAVRLRGTAAGAVCGALAVAAHGSAGTLPGSTALTLVLLVSGLVGAGAGAGGGSRIRMFALLGAGQAACHIALLLVAAPTGGHGGMPMATRPGWSMIVAHAVATVVCTLLIAAAERWYRAVTRVTRVLIAPFEPRKQARQLLIRGPQAHRFGRSPGPLGSISRRGPPVAAAH